MNFRKWIACLIVFAMVVPFALAEPMDCNESRAQGELDASMQHKTGGWFFGGVGSGMLLGLIGTGIITLAAGGSNPNPVIYPDEDDVSVTCYVTGYQDKARKKSMWAAAGGGLVGTAVAVLVVVSIVNSYY